MRVRAGMTVLAVVLAGIFSSAAVADAAFIAETRDPAGDSTSAEPAHDLLAAGFGFDRKSGHMIGVVKLRGKPQPENRALLSIFAAMPASNGCDQTPAAGFGAMTDGWTATWFRQDSATSFRQGEADRSGYRSTVQSFEIRDRRLAGKKWVCLAAVVVDSENPEIIYDQIPMTRFKGVPALEVKMPKVKPPVAPNRVRKLRVVVRNPGDGPLRNVRLRVLRTRGLKAVPKARRIGLVRPRSRKVVVLKVRVFRSAGKRAKLKVQVRSGKLKARGSSTIRLKLPKKKRPPRGGGGSSSGSGSKTCVQWFPDLSGESGGSLGLVPC